MGERQQAKDQQRRLELKDRRPVLGRLKLALEGPSTAGQSYLKGAVGEEKLGEMLDELTGKGIFVLHDRRRLRGTGNIDHLVVAPSGVWVIDAKRYTGLVERKDRGGWLSSDVRLTVGGRDRTRLVDGLHKQIADVQEIVAHRLDTTLVQGALCFIDGEFRLFAKPFEIDGVLITWRNALRDRLLLAGPLDAGGRNQVFNALRERLQPAM
jgi:Nuclease-related domain